MESEEHTHQGSELYTHIERTFVSVIQEGKSICWNILLYKKEISMA